MDMGLNSMIHTLFYLWGVRKLSCVLAKGGGGGGHMHLVVISLLTWASKVQTFDFVTPNIRRYFLALDLECTKNYMLALVEFG